MKKILYISLFIILGFIVKLLLSYDYPVVMYVSEYKITSSLFVAALLTITASAFIIMSAKFIVGALLLPQKLVKALVYEDPLKVMNAVLDKYTAYVAYGAGYIKNATVKNLTNPYATTLALLSSAKLEDKVQYSKAIIDLDAHNNLKFIAYKELAVVKLTMKNYDGALVDAKLAYKINQTPDVLSIMLQIALATKNAKFISENIELLEAAKYSGVKQLKMDASNMFYDMAIEAKGNTKDHKIEHKADNFELVSNYIDAALKYNPSNFDAVKLKCKQNVASNNNIKNADMIRKAFTIDPTFELFLLYMQYNNSDDNILLTIKESINTSEHEELYDGIKNYLSHVKTI